MKNRRKPLNERFKDFLIQAKERHGDKFNYSRVVYKNNSTPVEIICPVHNSFLQRPQNHLNSKEGCYQCGKNRAGKNHRLSKKEIIKRAEKVHGKGRYGYDKTVYVDSFTPIIITCPVHGDFKQQPNDHVYHGTGCKQCGYENKMSRGESKIIKFLEEHNVEYIFQHSFNDLKAADGKNYLRYDFYLPSQKMLIEFDGPHHNKPIQYVGSTTEKAIETHNKTVIYDAQKEAYAKDHHLHMLRIPYEHLNRVNDILSKII